MAIATASDDWGRVELLYPRQPAFIDLMTATVTLEVELRRTVD